MDGIWTGMKGAFTGPRIGFMIVIVIVLVALEYAGHGPQELADRARDRWGK